MFFVRLTRKTVSAVCHIDCTLYISNLLSDRCEIHIWCLALPCWLCPFSYLLNDRCEIHSSCLALPCCLCLFFFLTYPLKDRCEIHCTCLILAHWLCPFTHLLNDWFEIHFSCLSHWLCVLFFKNISNHLNDISDSMHGFAVLDGT